MDDNSTSKHNVVDYIGEAKDHFLKGRYNWSLGSESYQSNVLISRGRTVHGRNDEIVLFVLIQSSFTKPPFIGGFEYDLVRRQCCKQGFESLPTVQRIWDKVRNSNSGSGGRRCYTMEMDTVIRYKLNTLRECVSKPRGRRCVFNRSEPRPNFEWFSSSTTNIRWGVTQQAAPKPLVDHFGKR